MSGGKKTEKGIKPVKLVNIPEELLPYKQWVAWKAVRTGNGKVTKVPINPRCCLLL
jgi:primase-polymerase (primpol)-like protein